MRNLTTRVRLSSGLAGLVASMIMLAILVGIVPDKVAAMRDAAAWLVIELSKQPDFYRRLQAQQSDDANSRQDDDS